MVGGGFDLPLVPSMHACKLLLRFMMAGDELSDAGLILAGTAAAILPAVPGLPAPENKEKDN